MIKKPTAIFWFRRDLRLNDNAGLYHALKENESVALEALCQDGWQDQAFIYRAR
jgi:deoxyribodipyrimidine photolyase